MTPQPQPLPPALARLATALELSSGFLLFFITGPRDHADSVFIRLLPLFDAYGVRRCRISGPADLDFAAVLTPTPDPRPLIVFMSGLEQMTTEIRKEITERLNLLRDSWATYPARILFWLPSWGLSEFRRIAPDLFDWRSGLITLNDADLPIHDELEYLVWACERHGGGRPLPGGARRWNRLSEQIHELPTHTVLAGLDPAERHHVLRNFALGYARDALAAAAPRRFSPINLNTMNPGICPYTPSYYPLSPVPVLIRSHDAAGKLGGEDPWPALARAAGIPGPDAAAEVLADLATRGDLLVLLDGFDRLHLADHEAPRRWLEQLTTSAPPIRLLAATAGPVDGFFASWHRVSRELIDDLAEDDSVLEDPVLFGQSMVSDLLLRLFPTSNDLTALADYILGPEVDELPLFEARDVVAASFVAACARRGLLDASFFAELTRMRPAHAAEIETIADLVQ